MSGPDAPRGGDPAGLGKVENPPLCYQRDLWGSGPALFERFEQRMKSLDGLVEFIREKSALDQMYSRSLKRIAQTHLSGVGENEISDGNLRESLAGLRELVATLSVNFSILAAKQLDQMHAPLSATRANVRSEADLLKREAEKNSAALSSLRSQIIRSRDETRTLCRELVVARRRVDGYNDMMCGEKGVIQKLERQRDALQAKVAQTPKVAARHAAVVRKLCGLRMEGKRLSERVKGAKRNFDASDAKYVRSVKRCREFRGKHDSNMAAILRRCEGNETKRTDAVRRGLGLFLKTQKEFSRKLFISFQSILKQAKSVSTRDEIQAYIRAHRTQSIPSPLPTYVHFPSYEEALFEAKFNPKDYAHKPRRRRRDQPPTTAKQLELEQRGEGLLDAALAGGEDAAQAQADIYAMFRESDGRIAFAKALSSRRRSGFNEPVGNGLVLCRRAFESLATLIMAFLDHAHTAMHSPPAQTVMIMCQTFYIEESVPGGEAVAAGAGNEQDGDRSRRGSERRVYLQQRVKTHPIWKNARFWEESFFYSFGLELKRHARTQVARWHTDSEQAEATDRRKKILFGKLSTYAHNMLGFGMPAEPTRAFVEKMCQINEMGEAESAAILSIVQSLPSSQGSDADKEPSLPENDRNPDAGEPSSPTAAAPQPPGTSPLADGSNDSEVELDLRDSDKSTDGGGGSVGITSLAFNSESRSPDSKEGMPGEDPWMEIKVGKTASDET